MNKTRRKAIAAQAALIDHILGQLADIRGELETLRDEEQEAYDNMPESLQAGERGDHSQGAISYLESAISYIEDFEGCGVDSELSSAAE